MARKLRTRLDPYQCAAVGAAETALSPPSIWSGSKTAARRVICC